MEDKQQKKEKIVQINFKISEGLKKDWKRKFRERGHATLKGGIVAAVFNYLYLSQTATPDYAESLKQIKGTLDAIEKVNETLAEKQKRIESLDYKMPHPKKIEEQNRTLRAQLLDSIEMYQPVSITFLVQVTMTQGEKILPLLKQMRIEGLIDLTDKYEWVLK